ncbi:riboflavin-specific deaminase [Roseibium sp. TrichSKD4]|uniref:VOC family protein n=1 Tax=Roseibium sp. TrichSKD4 TaxID=744980 RepID=UPI0001E561EA|nr:VOC family protein [Roseibium sp. TrichSKD4]EFO34439.1 riboflavin-specific deaminase [Roseibium sp. TrichSKD4]
MLKLDHLTVIAPTLAEGVTHVQNCLDLNVPFGTHHEYMGTYNHRLQLGANVYLEIVALDPDGITPGRARWFGLDNQKQVRRDWEEGFRLRGWVANVDGLERFLMHFLGLFGEAVPLPPDKSEFKFAIPEDGSLPLDGSLPSLIDHCGVPTSMAEIPDLGARLVNFAMQHAEPLDIGKRYAALSVDRPPVISAGPRLKYTAHIDTSGDLKTLF